jgi:hypothetical protein
MKTTYNCVPIQTFDFSKSQKNKLFPKGESYWDFTKDQLIKAFDICDERSDDDFEVIIRPKNIK